MSWYFGIKVGFFFNKSISNNVDLTQCKNLLFVQLHQKFRENNFFRRRVVRRGQVAEICGILTLHTIFFVNSTASPIFTVWAKVLDIKRYLSQIFPWNQSVEKVDILLSRFLRKKLERFSWNRSECEIGSLYLVKVELAYFCVVVWRKFVSVIAF